ncbi:MAG: CocE/NonD family hydrolase, partial [Aestuariivirgaceae bacterium]
LEVIDWIAAQDWCTGDVGMMGISWGGFNGLQVAARRPEPLKAVITLCSTDDRYADDIHYKGGCVINENLGWSGTMLSYSSRPPDPVLVGDKWRELWLERLEAEPFLAAHWLQHQHRDGYWKHGSVCEDFPAIDAAVLAVGGWNDAYSNAIPRLVNGLAPRARGIIGPWAHKYPHFAVPEPRIGFLQEALRWWDHWLKGEDTGVSEDPAIRAYIMDSIKPDNLPANWPGRWIGDTWPCATTSVAELCLTPHGLRREPAGKAVMEICSPQTTGLDGGEYCVIWLGPEFPGDQARDDVGSLTFDAEVLNEDIDIVGAIECELAFTADRPVAFVAVRANDVHPGGAVTRITYAIRNLCHRDSHETPEPLQPGETYTVRIKLDDIAWRMPAGHKLRLSISTTYWPLMWPAPEPVTLTLMLGDCRLLVPVRQRPAQDKAPDFSEAVASPALQQEELRAPSHIRRSGTGEDGRLQMEIVDDFGAYRNLDHGLVDASIARETYSILPDDPLSARATTHWTQEYARDGWQVRTEAYSEMTASLGHFHLTARIEAYEGDERIFAKSWDETIERKLA